jgi:hypothetical protein
LLWDANRSKRKTYYNYVCGLSGGNFCSADTAAAPEEDFLVVKAYYHLFVEIW